MAQTILPFKLDTTRDSITAQAGLVLFGEFVIGLNLSGLCSTDAVGDWLRRTGSGTGLNGLARMNRSVVFRALSSEERTDYTLDMDATVIEAEKRSAAMTYKGFKGYTPRLCYLAENGLVLEGEFREGNVSPQTRNLGVLSGGGEAGEPRRGDVVEGVAERV